jgi:hypothetical protein
MFDKYYTKAYTIYQVHLIDDMILSVTKDCSINGKRKDLRQMCRDKKKWILEMEDVTSYVVDKVSKRKCNDCKKLWCDCRNTCYKAKTNPRPIEFPQDVFNIIKDYMGVYDIPEPITELMGMMKLKNLYAHRKIDRQTTENGKIITFREDGPIIKNLKDISVDERVRLYNADTIRMNKNWILDGSEILDIANKYPDLRFGKELTDNNKIFLLRLLFKDSYQGVHYYQKMGGGGLTTWRGCSLFDILCGNVGIRKSTIIPKKQKPYVMYMVKDEEYEVLVRMKFCGGVNQRDFRSALRTYAYSVGSANFV